MTIRIEYCVVWNYKTRALSLRDELSSKFGEIAELKPGDRGAFEVFLNNSLVFSKLRDDRFPDNQEIVLFIEGVLNVT